MFSVYSVIFSSQGYCPRHSFQTVDIYKGTYYGASQRSGLILVCQVMLTEDDINTRLRARLKYCAHDELPVCMLHHGFMVMAYSVLCCPDRTKVSTITKEQGGNLKMIRKCEKRGRLTQREAQIWTEIGILFFIIFTIFPVNFC